MEKLKNDEKAKHANRPDYYNQGCAFSVIGLMFLLLTVMTAYETFNVLPVPIFYYYGSLTLGMLLFASLLLLLSVWGDIPIPLKWYFIAGVLLIWACPVTGLFGSWMIGIIFFTLFGDMPAIPVVTFPIIVLVISFIAIMSWRISLTVPRFVMKLMTYAVVLFTSLYIWGHSLKFEGHVYDEGLKIDGTFYHTIMHYGWTSDPSVVVLYECGTWIFGCEQLYQSDYYDFRASETQLVFDEISSVLRLEHEAQEFDTVSKLYEHPIQQE